MSDTGEGLWQRIRKALITSALGRYLGLGLPKRDGKFSLVARFTTHKTTLEGDGDLLLNKWQALQDKPAALLDELANHLEQLHKSNRLTPDGYHVHLMFAVNYIYPLVEDYYYRFRRNGGIPDSPARTMLVEGGIRLVHLLLRGAAIQFQTDYLLPNHQLVKVLDRLGQSLLLLLELAWLLQNLYLIRYKKLPKDTFILIGKAYVAHLPFGDVEIKRTLISRSNLSLNLEAEAAKGSGRASASLNELFTLILLTGFMDTLTWRTEHLYMIAAMPTPPLLRPHGGEAVPEGCRIYSTLQGECVAPEKIPATSCFLLDFNPLQQNLERLLPAALATLSGDGGPGFAQPPYSTLNGYDLWSVFSLLQEGLSPSFAPLLLSDRVENRADLHVILGYISCYGLMYDHTTLPLSKFVEKNSLLLSLSQGSSILVGTQEEEKKGKSRDGGAEEEKVDRNIWQFNLDMGNGQEFYLNTTESDRSRPMRVGQVLLFLYKTDSGWRQGEMGYIRRLIRGSESKIYIGIHRFSEHYQSVVLKRRGGGDTTLKAMLVKDGDGSTCILFPPHPLFKPGTAIEMAIPGAEPRIGVLGQPVFAGLECRACRLD